MNINRRGFLRGLLAVAATAAMPVRAAVEFISPQFEAYISYFRWTPGVEPDDWRYVARIANVEKIVDPPAFADERYGRSPAIEALFAQRQLNAMPMQERAVASAAFVREGLAMGLFDD